MGDALAFALAGRTFCCKISVNRKNTELERWQLALHCHRRQPVSPVVLGFNHEAGYEDFFALTGCTVMQHADYQKCQ